MPESSSLCECVRSALDEARESYHGVTVALRNDDLETDYREQIVRARDMLGEAIDSLEFVAINLAVEA
jgi:hypothetical protein